MDAEIVRISLELVNELLKPPIRLVAITPGTLPEEAGIRYREIFNSIDDAYAYFRQKMPEGRWLLWLQGSDGETISVDSQAFESNLEAL